MKAEGKRTGGTLEFEGAHRALGAFPVESGHRFFKYQTGLL